MQSSWTARVVSDYSPSHAAPKLAAHLEHIEAESAESSNSLRRVIGRARNWLVSEQQKDGHWVGELQGDTLLESEYILFLAFMQELDSSKAEQAANYLISQQLSTGGWAAYPDGPVEISISVKAYFSLKVMGHDPSEELMVRARQAILAHGGADAVNSFTRFYLALLGQISYDQVPSVPPEFLLLPKWCPVNLQSVSSWSRVMIVPLSIMSSLKPVTHIDPKCGIRELFIESPEKWSFENGINHEENKNSNSFFSWKNFFLTVDRGLKFCERWNVLPLRKHAINKAIQWMIQRFEKSDGLGAIFPSMVWSIICLRTLGYQEDSAEMKYCRERLDSHAIIENGTLRIEPCKSPVWDTALSLAAISDSGLNKDHPAITSASEWLLSKEVKLPGDWSETVDVAPGGWYFEYENEFYPDVDDTAMAIIALSKQLNGTETNEMLPPDVRMAGVSENSPASEEELTRDYRILGAIHRAAAWLVAMQNKDGGWGAFDKDNDQEFLCSVPFADHNAMIDPSTPDITGHILEALAELDFDLNHPVVQKAVSYIQSTQEADGSWYGRWGVNYIYGTWQVLQGLTAIGIPVDDPMIQAGANWLLAYQQSSGAWGESPESYVNPSRKGQGDPTVSQTSWALLGLISAGLQDHPAVAQGMQYLMDQQLPEGTWEEEAFTGTGFPKVFYLRYHMYRHYFPLLALSRWAVTKSDVVPSDEPVILKCFPA